MKILNLGLVGILGGSCVFASSLTLQAHALNFSGSYSQNFDTLANTGTTNTWTDNSTIPGWYSNRTLYVASDGSVDFGRLYSFGSTNSTERSLGSIARSATGTIYYGVQLTNNTANQLTNFGISYTGEQWRNAANTNSQSLTFSYQLNAPNISDGTWTNFSSLNFTSPITGSTATALDGNNTLNRINISNTVPITLNAGESIWLRWEDIDDLDSDHGLAIDNLSVTASSVTAVPFDFNPSQGAALGIPLFIGLGLLRKKKLAQKSAAKKVAELVS